MQFEKDNKRTRELGRKGGLALHPNGTKTDHTYRYKKCTIRWLKTKHTWCARSDNSSFTLYARSVAELKKMITKERNEHPDGYIEATPEI